MSWIQESNRLKHLIYAIIPAIFFTFLFSAGLAFGMEFKDYLYGKDVKCFDWLDITATCIGGVIGQLIQIILLILIF